MTTRDPFYLAMDLLLQAHKAAAARASKARPSSSEATRQRSQKATRVKWSNCGIGDALRAPVARVVLTVRDARYGHEVVEVVTWSPRSRDAALRRLEAVLGRETLRGVRCELGTPA